MAIRGPGPFNSDNAFSEFGVVVTILAERVDRAINVLKEQPWPIDPVVHCLIVCLVALGKAYPQGLNASLDPRRVNAWREAYFAWLDQVEKRLPAKYREEMRSGAEKAFAQLAKMY
jgi:hypothetical protein